jgi:hypothetical protein
MIQKILRKTFYRRNYILNALNISAFINVDYSLNIMMAYASIVDSISIVTMRNNLVNTYTPKNNTFSNYKLKRPKVRFRHVKSAQVSSLRGNMRSYVKNVSTEKSRKSNSPSFHHQSRTKIMSALVGSAWKTVMGR